jgi:1-acyl-sn-glycerol-3-phosphate acyltransferase
MASGSFGSPLRAAVRILLYAGLTLALMPVQAVAVALRLPFSRTLPLWYHRQCCRILGMRIERRGRRSRARPTLFVANHASYFDIMVLAALVKASFVAKAEVAAWPLFGWLAKLQRTVFVERRVARTAEHRDNMADRLETGDSLILFAEGTSSDGNRVLPFKSALFSVAEQRPRGKPLQVQPVSIAYTRLDEVPMGRYLRPFFAWYGDMDMASHLWHAAGLGWVTVVVEFHPPVTIEELGSRKALCDHCQAMVAAGVAAALAGRPQEPALPAPAAATT